MNKQFLIMGGLLVLLVGGIVFAQEDSLSPKKSNIQILNEYTVLDGKEPKTTMYTFYLPVEKMMCYATYHSWAISCIKEEEPVGI